MQIILLLSTLSRLTDGISVKVTSVTKVSTQKKPG